MKLKYHHHGRQFFLTFGLKGRLLILSGFPQAVERGDKIWRENCERMNALADLLASHSMSAK